GRRAGPRTRPLTRAFQCCVIRLFPRETSGSSLHLASVPLIDIEIPQKANAWHVKGNSPIGPLIDVLALANRHHQAWGPQASSCIERDYAANQAMEESHDHFTKRRTSH